MLTMSTAYGATTAIGTIPNLCTYLMGPDSANQTSATLLNLVNQCAGISSSVSAIPNNVSCNLSSGEKSELQDLIRVCQGFPGNDVVKCLKTGYCTPITSSR